MELKAVANTRGAKAIREAMQALLWERSYEDITVSDIIVRSTYSKSCFYQNYCDKLDVVEQIMQEEAFLYVQELISGMNHYMGITDEIKYNYHISLKTFQYIKNKQKFYSMLFDEKIPTMGLDYFCDLAIKNFKQMEKFQINSDCPKEELDFFEYCNTNLVLRYIQFWKLHDFQETPEQMANHVAALCRLSKPGGVYC